jgi:hypothetical protein
MAKRKPQPLKGLPVPAPPPAPLTPSPTNRFEGRRRDRIGQACESLNAPEVGCSP